MSSYSDNDLSLILLSGGKKQNASHASNILKHNSRSLQTLLSMHHNIRDKNRDFMMNNNATVSKKLQSNALMVQKTWSYQYVFTGLSVFPYIKV